MGETISEAINAFQRDKKRLFHEAAPGLFPAARSPPLQAVNRAADLSQRELLLTVAATACIAAGAERLT
jgi:hypothetical protein